MSFTVTILGSGAALPTANRNPTSQYVCCNDRHILIDCGEGTQTQLRKFNVKIQKITHILISHLHGDHYFGLVGLLSTMNLLGRNQGIKIYGPKGLEQIIKLQFELSGHPISFSTEFIELDGKNAKKIFEDRKIEIHTFPLKHRIPTNGFIIKEKKKDLPLNAEKFKADNLSLQLIPFFKKGEDVIDNETGKTYSYKKYTLPALPSYSYAYCSDTQYWETIIPHISEATVLYHEATFIEKEKDRAKATGHSTAKQAAKIAKQANIKQLLLGHISARYENTNIHLAEAKEVFDNVLVVEDGDEIIVK